MRPLLATTLLLAACGAPAPLPAVAPPPDVASADATAEPLASAAPSASALPPLPESIRQLEDTSRTPTRAKEIVRSLVDEVGERLAGSPSDRIAVAWGLRTMKAHGLSNVHSEKVMVKHWERGAESATLLVDPPRPLAITALGGSDATAARGIDADVVEVHSMAELAKLDKGAAAGKIVFLDQPTERTHDGSGYGKAVGGRVRGARLAQGLGAVAFVIRSIGTDDNRLPHAGAKSKDDKGIPAGALSVPDAELLHRTLEEKKSARLHLVLTPKWLPDAESANVVGEIVGRDRPGEIVLLGAHLDSWDLGEGAIDDGAGDAIVLDAAQRISELAVHPRRTVRVVLFANEEHGRDGGDTYAKSHAGEVAHHVAAMEADLGADRAYAARYRGAPEARPRFAQMADVLKPLGVETDMGLARGGSDIEPLGALGVPLIDIAQDATRYFDWHHTANDTLDKVDAAQIEQVAAAFAALAWSLAESEDDLGRIPEAERNVR
jgi:carboxypeptidase Q